MTRIKPIHIAIILLILTFAVSLYLRTYLPYDRVFSIEGVKYTSADAYFHLHQVDSLVHNFPIHTSIDPYLIYPGTGASGEMSIGFFIWLITVPAWIIGLGSPTQHIVDLVGVYLPAILGALCVIPVFIIGKELINHWAGVLAAALLAILPGEFLGRSILGFTDYHIAEAFFSSVTIMFLVLAIKAASQRKLTMSHVIQRDWATIRKPFIYSLLSALFMGIYMFTWLGALLFVFIIAIFFVFQFIIDHLKQKPIGYLTFVSIIFFSVTLIFSLIISSSSIYRVSLIIAILISVVLGGLSKFFLAKQIKSLYYPFSVIGIGLLGIGLLYLVNPGLIRSMLGAFSIFAPSGAQLTTIEMQPLISLNYTDPFQLAWGNFTTSFFVGIAALVILILVAVRQGNAEKSLLLVWSLVILAATLGQRRFGYYLSINIALLTGYLAWSVLDMGGLRELTNRAAEIAKKTVSGRPRRRRRGSSVFANYFVLVLALIVIIVIVYPWNIDKAIAVASSARFAPSNSWVSSLKWMHNNTPEPFGNPDSYYAVYDIPSTGQAYQYPESAYGVLAWWDYGYWITRIGHRLPVANPSQDPLAIKNVAFFFTSPDEESANEIREELNVSYVIIDHETSLGKFWAIATWASEEIPERVPAAYFSNYIVQYEDNSLRSVVLYYPEYYRTLVARLYNFDGMAVIPESTTVISYEENIDDMGRQFKLVTGAQQFATYEEAEVFLASQETGNYRIVSANPMVSPVPLEPVEHYKLVHSSNGTLPISNTETVPAVKIFEYVR